MGQAASAPASERTLELRSYDEVLAELRSASGAKGAAVRAQRLLVELADSSVESSLPVREHKQGERYATRDDVRRSVELLHEALGVVGVDCYGCQLGELGRELLNDRRPRWTVAETIEYMRRYALGVCGFIDADDKWSIDDRVLARIGERLDKAVAVAALVRAADERDGVPPPDEAERAALMLDDPPAAPDVQLGAALPTEGRLYDETEDGPGTVAGGDDGYNSEEHEVDDVGVIAFIGAPPAPAAAPAPA